MNPLASLVLLPGMRAIGRVSYVNVFRQTELCTLVSSPGFDILATENHATKGNDRRPCTLARKRYAAEVGETAAQ